MALLGVAGCRYGTEHDPAARATPSTLTATAATATASSATATTATATASRVAVPTTTATAATATAATATAATATAATATAATATATATPTGIATATAATPRDPLGRTVLQRSDLDWSHGPLYLTASFDGSQRFAMWADTLQVARQLRDGDGRGASFTYFINACYYSTTVEGSRIGRASSDAEVLVRLALTQQAINEGHDIANHGVRHDDGSGWNLARWTRELDEFHGILDGRLFRPLRDGEGGFVFPRFEPLAGAGPGALGARCQHNSDCDSGRCLPLTARTRLCSQPCNARRPCPSGTVCGAPGFQRDTDQCLVPPRYPIVHQGKPLFFANGRPNPDHPALKRYRVLGFRAPFLAFHDTLIEALLVRRYGL